MGALRALQVLHSLDRNHGVRMKVAGLRRMIAYWAGQQLHVVTKLCSLRRPEGALGCVLR